MSEITFETSAVADAFASQAKTQTPYFTILTKMATELAAGVPDDKRTAASFTVATEDAARKAANLIRETARTAVNVSARIRTDAVTNGVRVTFSVVPRRHRKVSDAATAPVAAPDAAPAVEPDAAPVVEAAKPAKPAK